MAHVKSDEEYQTLKRGNQSVFALVTLTLRLRRKFLGDLIRSGVNCGEYFARRLSC